MNNQDDVLKYSLIIGIPLIILMIIIYVISGLPSDVKKNILTITTNISTVSKTLDTKEKEFNSKIGLNKIVDEYIKRENIAKSFDLAKGQDKQLQAIKTQFENILKKDSKDDIPTYTSLFSQVTKLLNSFRDNINNPMIVYTNLVRIQQNQAKIISDSNSILKISEEKLNKFLVVSDQFIAKFEEKTKDILLKKEAVSKVFNELKSINENVNTEKDLFKFSELEKAFTLKNKALIDILNLNVGLYEQLNTSYSKILSDMNVKYYVLINRSSWDESSDFSGSDHSYAKKEISEAEYLYLEKTTDSLATYASVLYGSGLNIKIALNVWNRLNIKEEHSDFPCCHNSAEWWIEDLTIEYFHQYTYIKNAETTVKWESVTEDVFYANLNNLNMELLSKPYGKYESEKSTSPVPAGLSYVGNKQYGEWKTDNTGNSFWHYYGMYSFMNNMFFDNHRYSRQDYSNYSYGKSYNDDGKYGSSGTYKSKNHSKSNFEKVFKSKEYSEFKSNNVKSAGSAARGRGPSGGGK